MLTLTFSLAPLKVVSLTNWVKRETERCPGSFFSNSSFSSNFCCRPLFHVMATKSISISMSKESVVKEDQIPIKSKDVYFNQKKLVWLWTQNRLVMTAAVEAGWSTFLFRNDDQSKKLATSWKSMARIHPFFIKEDQIVDESLSTVEACYYKISKPEELQALILTAGESKTVVMDALDWQVIPAENVIAAFQHSMTKILAVAGTSKSAEVALQALEIGTDGVVLRTEDPSEVFAMKEYLQNLARNRVDVSLASATVLRVTAVGMGDRVCVDLCSLLKPGEGLLVGSFARCLFLIHSECLEVDYVASRPFRVNAGPVHAYVATPGGKTGYLAELQSGAQVLVIDGSGKTRSAIVGRVKIESRPLMLVEAQVDGESEIQSLLLQNAETVRLVQPGDGSISVSVLKPGDQILVAKQEAVARHTGLPVKEFIVER